MYNMTDVRRVQPFNVPSNVNCWCETDIPEESKVCYMWRIKKFSKLQQSTGERLVSSIFSAIPYDKNNWSLHLYPRGDSKKSEAYVSLYLKYETVHLNYLHVCSSTFELSILNNYGDKTETENGSHDYTAEKTSCGFPEFIERDFLLNESNGLLPNDELTIYCEVVVPGKPMNTHYSNTTVIQENQGTVSRITEDLGRLLKSKILSDVVLVAGDRELRAHKTILAARSPVFAAMFEHDTLENRENRVVISDIGDTIMGELVRFIYTGKVHAALDEVLVMQLLYAADKYDLQDLKTICEKELSAKVTAKNIAQMIPLASLHNASHLKARLVEYMKSCVKNDDAVMNTLWERLINEQPNPFLPGIFQTAP